MAGRSYSYFVWETMPCRVAMEGEVHGSAEMYRAGKGLVEAPLSSLLFDGRPITKREFDQMVLALATAANRLDSEE
jgi:hypothetical protein